MNEVEVVNERQRDPEERAEEEWRVRKRESWFLHLLGIRKVVGSESLHS